MYEKERAHCMNIWTERCQKMSIILAGNDLRHLVNDFPGRMKWLLWCETCISGMITLVLLNIVDSSAVAGVSLEARLDEGSSLLLGFRKSFHFKWLACQVLKIEMFYVVFELNQMLVKRTWFLWRHVTAKHEETHTWWAHAWVLLRLAMIWMQARSCSVIVVEITHLRFETEATAPKDTEVFDSL